MFSNGTAIGGCNVVGDSTFQAFAVRKIDLREMHCQIGRGTMLFWAEITSGVPPCRMDQKNNTETLRGIPINR